MPTTEQLKQRAGLMVGGLRKSGMSNAADLIEDQADRIDEVEQSLKNVQVLLDMALEQNERLANQLKEIWE